VHVPELIEVQLMLAVFAKMRTSVSHHYAAYRFLAYRTGLSFPSIDAKMVLILPREIESVAIIAKRRTPAGNAVFQGLLDRTQQGLLLTAA
jgi:hypothetical protein